MDRTDRCVDILSRRCLYLLLGLETEVARLSPHHVWALDLSLVVESVDDLWNRGGPVGNARRLGCLRNDRNLHDPGNLQSDPHGHSILLRRPQRILLVRCRLRELRALQIRLDRKVHTRLCRSLGDRLLRLSRFDRGLQSGGNRLLGGVFPLWLRRRFGGSLHEGSPKHLPGPRGLCRPSGDRPSGRPDRRHGRPGLVSPLQTNDRPEGPRRGRASSRRDYRVDGHQAIHGLRRGPVLDLHTGPRDGVDGDLWGQKKALPWRG
mmetsp:Transcript_109264/g.223156  ORF Transcript_109264/g.223156 Transcript_109264/m.223156 type:complete len:263 (-) Transcript_109264:702-1490(-)